MSVIKFQSAGDRHVSQMVDQICAVVHGQPTLAGVDACLQTLAILIVGYCMEHGGADEITERCGSALHDLVEGLASDMVAAEVAKGQAS